MRLAPKSHLSIAVWLDWLATGDNGGTGKIGCWGLSAR